MACRKGDIELVKLLTDTTACRHPASLVEGDPDDVVRVCVKFVPS
jgi:hypothetical protein